VRLFLLKNQLGLSVLWFIFMAECMQQFMEGNTDVEFVFAHAGGKRVSAG
jgi:hypothetical protein